MADTTNTNSKEINPSFIDDVLGKNISVDTESNQALVSNDLGSKLVQSVADASGGKLDFASAFIGIAIIAQKGGTSKGAQNDIYANVNGQKITLKDIRDVIRAKNYKFTLRQWARTYATYIHKIAARYSIIGDLAKKINRKHTNISQDDFYWLSNFQMDNEDCPLSNRELIMEHYSELFPGSKSKS